MINEVSIVVPVYNEAPQFNLLGKRITQLAASVKEIVVVDGGSNDGTFNLLKASFNEQNIHVMRSAKGRANQMNQGARKCTSHWLFFLHADTELTVQHIKQALQESSISSWGHFNIKLSGDAQGLRMVESMINWRSKISGVATGDQCIFVRRSRFEKLNGFGDMPLMEDVDLCKRLLKYDKPVMVNMPLVTSSRKWEKEGLWRTIFLMWRLRFAFWRGVSPSKLVKHYYK